LTSKAVGACRQIDLQLVEEAVARGEEKLDLVLLGHVGAGVVEIGHRAQRRLLRPAGPAQNGHLGHGRGRQCGHQRRRTKQMS
jgi:hypothetical protein